MLVRPATKEYRTWVLDSRRWKDYQPRAGDVIVATYPKSGTTWTQQIVNLLIFQTPDARPIGMISPWVDRRMPQPIEDVLASIEAQTHRRALKSHLPLDGLPLYDEVKYIHVARDGRDVVMSFHNHGTGFKSQMLGALDAQGLKDETLGRPYPRLPENPADYFGRWLREGPIAGQSDGYNNMSYFELEKTYWDARSLKNLLLLHYNDLKSDLEGEMRKIAGFLDISISDEKWPALVMAADFSFMKEQGSALMPGVTSLFEDGKDRFFNKGYNGRWRDVFRQEDLELYDRKLSQFLSPACRTWLEQGTREAGDPKAMPD